MNYFTLIDSSKQRVVIAMPRVSQLSSFASVTPDGPELVLTLGTALFAKLNEPLTRDRWELAVFVEDESGHVRSFCAQLDLTKTTVPRRDQPS